MSDDERVLARRFDVGPNARALPVLARARVERAASGRQALERWLLPADPAPRAGVPSDPLRPPVLALGLLSPSKRRRFVDRAEADLQATIAELRRTASAAPADRWIAAAHRGALGTMLARLRWVRSLRTVLREGGPHRPASRGRRTSRGRDG